MSGVFNFPKPAWMTSKDVIKEAYPGEWQHLINAAFFEKGRRAGLRGDSEAFPWKGAGRKYMRGMQYRKNLTSWLDGHEWGTQMRQMNCRLQLKRG